MEAAKEVLRPLFPNGPQCCFADVVRFLDSLLGTPKEPSGPSRTDALVRLYAALTIIRTELPEYVGDGGFVTETEAEFGDAIRAALAGLAEKVKQREAEADADIEAGRLAGPFATPEALIEHLREPSEADVERVARVMYDAESEWWANAVHTATWEWEDESDAVHSRYLVSARAVIAMPCVAMPEKKGEKS